MPIIWLRNLDPYHGVCNGTRGVIIEIKDHVLKIQILETDQIITQSRIRIDFTVDMPNVSFPFSRHQYPIRPAFATTINKSEGQTYDKIGIDLRFPVFAHGQLYTAFSRVGSSKNVKILLPSEERIMTNVVSDRVISMI